MALIPKSGSCYALPSYILKTMAVKQSIFNRVNRSDYSFVKAKFHYAIQLTSWFEAGSKLVADLQRAEIWQLTSSELARVSTADLRQVHDQLRTCLRPASSMFERAISTYRDSSKLLEADRRPVRSQIRLRYPGRRQVRRSKLVADRFERASNPSATSFEPASNQPASWIA